MKKVAVGTLGEFWYGDYKEPFVQLEGGVPGYPQGVLLKDDEGALLCAFCGGVYHNLGRHVGFKHRMTASTYKDEVGLFQRSALVSERVRLTRVRAGLKSMRNPRSATHPANADRSRSQLASYRPKAAANAARGIQHRHAKPEHQNKTGRCFAQVLTVARQLQTERRLTQHNLARHGIGRATVETHFGSWDNLVRAVGGTPPNRYTDQHLLLGIRALADQLGRTPTQSDMRRFGMPNIQTYVHRFGSWAEACRKAGLQPNLPHGSHPLDPVTVLVAYATVGSTARAALRLGTAEERVSKVLADYGFPFPQRSKSPDRLVWAADMARRLAGEEYAA